MFIIEYLVENVSIKVFSISCGMGLKKGKKRNVILLPPRAVGSLFREKNFSLQLSLIVKKGNYAHKSEHLNFLYMYHTQDETLSTTAQLSPKQTFKIMFL